MNRELLMHVYDDEARKAVEFDVEVSHIGGLLRPEGNI